MVVGTKSLNEQLLSDDYFSNLNPRAVSGGRGDKEEKGREGVVDL